MRLHFLGFLGAVSVSGWVLLVACSSDDSSGGGGGDPIYEPPGNGVPMSESAACQAITSAEDARRAALSCGPVTRPPCPTYLQKGNPACSEYDQGTVNECVAYIGKHASCDALTKKKCVVKVIPGSAPNGCAVLDAGPDAPEDSGQDAPDDSAADAGNDAPAEAAGDAAADGNGDSASDAAGD